MVCDHHLLPGVTEIQRTNESDDGAVEILPSFLSQVLLIRLGDLHSKEDAIDGS